MFALALRQSSSFAASSSSSSSRRRSSSLRNVSIAQTRDVRRHDRLRLKTWTLRASSSSDDEEDEDDFIDEDRADVRSIEDAKRELEYGMRFGKRMKKRFQPKKVKDRGLPIADALVLTSATVLVALVSLSQHKAPSWLNAEYLSCLLYTSPSPRD